MCACRFPLTFEDFSELPFYVANGFSDLDLLCHSER
jgi:hypothetical protein